MSRCLFGAALMIACLSSVSAQAMTWTGFARYMGFGHGPGYHAGPQYHLGAGCHTAPGVPVEGHYLAPYDTTHYFQQGEPVRARQIPEPVVGEVIDASDE